MPKKNIFKAKTLTLLYDSRRDIFILRRGDNKPCKLREFYITARTRERIIAYKNRINQRLEHKLTKTANLNDSP